MRTSIQLGSSADGAKFKGKLNNIESPLFEDNRQVFYRGALANNFVKQVNVGSGLVAGDDVLAIIDKTLMVNEQPKMSYLGDYFISPVQDLSSRGYVALEAGSDGILSALKISGAVATIDTYTIETSGELTALGSSTLPIFSLSSAHTFRLQQGSVIQIGVADFAIDGTHYDLAISQESKFFKIAGDTQWLVVQPYVSVIHIDATTATLTNLANTVNAYQDGTQVILPTLGDTERAYYVADNLPGSTPAYYPFQLPTPASGASWRIYSQTFNLPCAFTIFTDGTNYVWADAVGYGYLETTINTDLEVIPTVDWNRTGTGENATSLLTTQFNKAYFLHSGDADSPTTPFALIYQSGNLLTASFNGVLVLPVGVDGIEGLRVQTVQNGLNFAVTLGTSYFLIGQGVTPRISQISKTLFKINVANLLNIYNSRNNTLYVGSSDWNNRVKPEQVLPLIHRAVDFHPAVTVSYNSAIGGNYENEDVFATSILAGSYHLTSRSETFPKMTAPLDAEWEEVSTVTPLVDYYYGKAEVATAPGYQTTGFIYRKTGLDGLLFPEPALGTIIVPSPVNAEYKPNQTGVNFITWGPSFANVGLSYDYKYLDAYILTNQFRVDGDIFAISGAVFLYTEGTIWGLPFNDGAVGQRVYIVSTDGMAYLGSNSTTAFFLSSDGFLWLFQGSYELTQSIQLSSLGTFQGISAYCQNTDELQIVFGKTGDDEEITYRTVRIVKGQTLFHDYPVERVSVDSRGIWMYHEGSALQLTTVGEAGDVYEPFRFSSGWVGEFNDNLTMFSRIWIKLDEKSTCRVRVETLNDFKVDTQEQVLSGDEFVVVPKQGLGRAINIHIDSEDFIRLCYLVVDYDTRGKTSALVGRGR